MSGLEGNSALYFVDRHAQGPLADKPAFVEASGAKRTMTYGELAADSGRMAELYEKHGIRREDRVAMLVLDQVEFPVGSDDLLILSSLCVLTLELIIA